MYIPIIAIHPSEFLKDELEARGISYYDAHDVFNVDYFEFTNFISGETPLTDDFAKKIAKYFNQDYKTWLNLQTTYELAKKAIDDKLND